MANSIFKLKTYEESRILESYFRGKSDFGKVTFDESQFFGKSLSGSPKKQVNTTMLFDEILSNSGSLSFAIFSEL